MGDDDNPFVTKLPPPPPLHHPHSRKHVRYRKIQSKIYNFLERPASRAEVSYHVLVFCLVFLCLALSVFSTIDGHEEEAGHLLFYLEILTATWFGVEFGLRLWSAGCRSRFQGAVGRARFLKSPFCCIDIVTICASVVVLSGEGGQVYAASAIRGLRFFQILRMVRMDRRGGTWKLLGSVVYAHRQELLTTLYIDFLILIFSSFVLYLVEKDENEHISSFAHALWWGVITLCTVGYGDTVPVTWKGKLIACFSAVAGISFFALPAGILGSGFALKVQQQQRQKHMIRRRVPAATLIQCLWRCYAVSESHSSQATWRVHMLTSAAAGPKSPMLPFKNNASFVRRLSIRRPRHSARSPVLEQLRNKINSQDLPPSGDESTYAQQQQRSNRLNSDAFLRRNSEDEEELLAPALPLVLTQRHKGAIRAIRKLKYLVAKRKFREALKPYDIKDVIESYSTGHSDLMTKVKNVQGRLDQILGKQDSKAKDVYDSKFSLASRIVNMERQVDSIEEKLQAFLELYQEDRKRMFAMSLSGQETTDSPAPSPASTCTDVPRRLGGGGGRRVSLALTADPSSPLSATPSRSSTLSSLATTASSSGGSTATAIAAAVAASSSSTACLLGSSCEGHLYTSWPDSVAAAEPNHVVGPATHCRDDLV